MRWYLLIIAVTALATFVATWGVWRFSLKHRIYPQIRERDVHQRPIPRLGGVAMFIGVLVAFAVASQLDYLHLVFNNPGPVWALLGAALLIVVVGALDDLFDLDWMIKLGAQMLAGGILAWQGVQILSLPIGGRVIGSPLLGLVITILAVVITMNAVNFIDGLDGLVAGVAIIANGVFLVYTYLLAVQSNNSSTVNLASLISAILLGVCLGFLPWNWHPAKIFMGDSGALLVGLLMATSALAVTGQVDSIELGNSELLPAFIPILLPFAILIVPLLDFIMAVVRRLSQGKSPFAADRRHLHHRLLDLGHSHRKTVILLYAWTATFSVGLLLFFILQSFFDSYYPAIPIFLLGVAICTWVTVSPILERRSNARKTATAEQKDQTL
ncbi:MAG: MraY family glycosyltransferase [Microbacteriaceae bacterium]